MRQPAAMAPIATAVLPSKTMRFSGMGMGDERRSVCLWEEPIAGIMSDDADSCPFRKASSFSSVRFFSLNFSVMMFSTIPSGMPKIFDAAPRAKLDFSCGWIPPRRTLKPPPTA